MGPKIFKKKYVGPILMFAHLKTSKIKTFKNPRHKRDSPWIWSRNLEYMRLI